MATDTVTATATAAAAWPDLLLSGPDGDGRCSCLRCRFTVLAVPVEGEDEPLLIDPSAAERRWLAARFPAERLRFSPLGGDWFTFHDHPRLSAVQ